MANHKTTMKKNILISILLLFLFSQQINAQYANKPIVNDTKLAKENKSLKIKIDLLQQEINNIKDTLNLKAYNSELEFKIDSFQAYFQKIVVEIEGNINKKASIVKIESIKNRLEDEVKLVKSNINSNNTQLMDNGKYIKNISVTLDNQGIYIQHTSGKVEKNNQYILLIFLLSLMLLISCFVIYRLTSKNKINISSTKDDIKDILKLDNNLIKILEKHTKLLENIGKGGSEEETLKSVKMVADEITTMENNIFQMDPKIKGLNRIVRAIKNLRNNYKVIGYDIPVLLGNEFNEGDIMEVISDMPDEKIEKGKRIITRIVSPRIDHKGKMIQRAKVELKSNL